MKITNKTYDILKFIALIVLPFAEFVGAMAHIWGFAYGAEIVASLVAVDALLGTLVKILADQYHKGESDGTD